MDKWESDSQKRRDNRQAGMLSSTGPFPWTNRGSSKSFIDSCCPMPLKISEGERDLSRPFSKSCFFDLENLILHYSV